MDKSAFYNRMQMLSWSVYPNLSRAMAFPDDDIPYVMNFDFRLDHLIKIIMDIKSKLGHRSKTE